MGFNQKELLIMSHLRENSRKNLTKISKETKIAVSTIFDKIKKYEGGIIKKHTCILDFTKLGFERFGDENDKNSKITCMRLKL